MKHPIAQALRKLNLIRTVILPHKGWGTQSEPPIIGYHRADHRGKPETVPWANLVSACHHIISPDSVTKGENRFERPGKGWFRDTPEPQFLSPHRKLFTPPLYLSNVLSRIADQRINRIEELLPWNLSAESLETQVVTA